MQEIIEFNECANVKVSRRHASLDWADDDDDGVAIEALFSQPTFVVVAGVRSKLKSGEKATLKHGDTFGLLPHAAWYRINLPDAARQDDKIKDLVTSNTPRDSGVELEGVPSCSSADNSDPTVPSKLRSNDVTAQPSQSQILSTSNGSSRDAKFSCAKVDAVRNWTLCAANVDKSDSNADASLAAKQKSVTAQESTSFTLTAVVDAVAEKIGEAYAARDVSCTTGAAVKTTTTSCTATSSRARTLPSWMTQEPAATSSPKQNPLAGARKKKNTTRRKQVKIAPTKRSGQLSSSENEDNEVLGSLVKNCKLFSPNRFKVTENEMTSKRALHQLSESDDDGSSLVRATEVAVTVSHAEVSDPTPVDGVSNTSFANSDDPSVPPVASIDVQNGNFSLHSRLAKAEQSLPEVNSGADEEHVGGSDTKCPAGKETSFTNALSAAPSSAKRKSCAYGASCYRRNPQHKKDEAHPGDPDYNSGEDTDEHSDSERPHCEYGVDCYRKNPEHRSQYKHTRIPQPQRRMKRKRAAKGYAGQPNDSDSPDESDLEFLNDASSDDYAPSGSDESDSERFTSQPLDENEKNELKRMGKEAKKFIKRGK
ncbi:Zinc finger C2H2 APLF-like [Trinorchestia longiramus]|nr:Zinc finger C2H2 APLF-like [Trinorchestia longiramus]